jgi:type I restriction enzyme, S subunit
MNNSKKIDEWVEVTLRELGSTYNGLTGKCKEDFGFGRPFITYMNVFSDGVINPEKIQYVNILEDDNQTAVQYGDILFTTSSETAEEVGMSSVLLEDLPDTYLNSFCFGFRLNNFDRLVPDYARYLFRGSDVRRVITKLAQGSTRFNLSKSALLNKLTVRLPPISDQKIIAYVLSTVDEKLDVIDAQIDQTQELKKGLMQQLLTKGIGHNKFKDSPLGEIPFSWEIVTIGDKMNLINGCAFKPTDWEQTGLPIIRIQNLNSLNAPFNYSTKKVDKKYLVSNDDILFAWSGSKGVSFGARIWKRGKGILNQHIFRVEPCAGLDKVFSYYVLRDVQGRIESHAHGFKASFVHVTKADLNTVQFALPPLKEQKEIAMILGLIDSKLDTLQLKNNLYKDLKKSLMQQLLTGKLRVNHLIENEVLA